VIHEVVTLRATCERCSSEQNYFHLGRKSEYARYPLPDGWKAVVTGYSQEGYPYTRELCPQCLKEHNKGK